MLFRQMSIWIIFLLMLISCFYPLEGIALIIGESSIISINCDYKFEASSRSQRNVQSLQSPDPSDEIKDKSKASMQSEIQKFRSNKETWGFFEWAQNLLVFAQFILVVSCIVGIFAMGYYSISIVLGTKREVATKLNEVERSVEYKVSHYLEGKYPDIYDLVNDKIENYLENDFSKALEQRYLYMEYVYISIWEELCPAINTEILAGNSSKAIRLWNKLYVAQLALRQMLSKDQIELGNGMAEIRGAAQDKLVNPDQLWDFICLLNEQNRLSPENLHLARELGREIGKQI